MLYKKQIFLTLFLSIFLFGSLLNASKIDDKTKSILELGKEMSNMRDLLGIYTSIGVGIQYKKPKNRLLNGIKEYEDVLSNIKSKHNDKPIQISIVKSKKAWAPVKKALMTANSNVSRDEMRKEALFIHANIRSVIKELAAMKAYLLSNINTKYGAELNAAIEIGASANRLSAHYMMKIWKLDDPTIEKHWNNGVKIYTDSIKILKSSKFYSNEEFKQELDKAEKILTYFIMLADLNSFAAPALVTMKSNKSLKNAQLMTKIILKSIIQ